MFVKLKTITVLLVLIVITFLASTGFTSPQRVDSHSVNLTPVNSPKPFRFVAKLKINVALQVENFLTQTNLEFSKASPGNLQSLFKKYKIKRMTPLTKNLIRWKKQTGKTEKDFTKLIQNKYQKRSRRYQGTMETHEFSRIYLIEPEVNNAQEFDKMLAQLRKDVSFEYVEPDRIVTVQMTPNDPYYSSYGSWGQAYDDLYGLKKMACSSAWDLATGGGITVAVVDTGTDKTHPDLAANLWNNTAEIPDNGLDDDNNGYIDDTWGWDFVNNDNNPADDHGHGAHVAGTIAAAGNNSFAIIGVAPDAKIMTVKGIGADGYGTDSALAEAIIYAANNGTDVINTSWGGPGYSQVITDAIDYAYGLGVVIVAAAGNDNQDVQNFYPASFANVITVAASEYDCDYKAWFSNWGSKIDVTAPGVDIISLRASGTSMGTPLNDYITRASGTSMAAPHAAGLAALILSRHPEFSVEQIRQVIRLSAQDVQSPGFDVYSGYGRINANQALSINNVLEAHIQSPVCGSVVTGNVSITGSANGSNLSEYLIEYGPGNEPTTWTLIQQGNSPVAGDQLAVFNTALVPDGIYTIRLTAKDNSSPVRTFQDRIELKVDYISITNPAHPTVPSLAKLFKPGTVIPISGTAAGPAFQHFRMEWAEGLNPTEWFNTGFVLENNGYTQISNGLLANWDSSVFPNRAGYYQIRLLVDNSGFTSETRTLIYLEPDLISENWPQSLSTAPTENDSVSVVTDANGQPNLVIALPSYWNVAEPAKLIRYSATGTIQYTNSFNAGFYYQAAVGNLDGNPGEEVVTIQDNLIRITKPDNTFTEFSPNSAYSYNESPIVLQDLNNDSTPEILALGDNYPNKVKYLYALNAQGSLLNNNFPITVLDNAGSISTRVYFLAADLDNDGNREIITQNYDSSRTSFLNVYNSNGTPRNWVESQPLFPSAQIKNMAAADLDHNGQMEMIITVSELSGAYRIYVLNATGSIKSGWPITITSWKNDMGIADMDRDGADEIIISDANSIRILRLDGTAFSDAWPYNDYFLGRFSVGDLNGDGFPEILTSKYCPYEYIPDPSVSMSGGAKLSNQEIAGKYVANVNARTRNNDSYSTLRAETSPEIRSWGSRFYTEYQLFALDQYGQIIKTWKILGVDGNQPFDPNDPLIGDFDNDGKVDLAITYGLVEGGGPDGEINTGAITVYNLDADYNPHYQDWPINLHDPQNSAVRAGASPLFAEIRLNETSFTLAAGTVANVVATAVFPNNDTHNITNSAVFTIADPRIATVDATGRITGLLPGTTALTVSYAGRATTVPVVVGPPNLSAISLDAAIYNIPLGATQNVIVTATYSDNTTQIVTGSVTYQITDNNVAIVESAGMIKGLTSNASTVLTVSFQGKTSAAQINVVEPVLSEINLDMSCYNIPAGLTQNVTVSGVYSDNSTLNITSLATYQITDLDIAMVDAGGVITGLTLGSTVLTVSFQGKTAAVGVNVTEATLTGITLGQSCYTIAEGSYQFIEVRGVYSDHSTQLVTYQSTYQVADPNIAIVDSYFTIRGLAPGATEITVSYQEKTAIAQVIIEKGIKNISFDQNEYFLPAGLTTNVTVTVTYLDDSTGDITTSATYQSTDSGIATINGGTIQGITPGSVALLAFYKGYAAATIAYIDPPVITAINFVPATFAVSVDATQNFTVTAVYSDGSVLDITSNAYYWISDSGIAALDDAGVIRGVGYGATTLNLYYEGQFASVPVNVL